tara:strand:- start:19 stop:516 length:498 start_codon:yes stop_codon:yes gene_type:complete
MDFNNKHQSSRINLENYNSKPFQLYENLNVKNNKFDKMTGNTQSSNISELYFSQENVDYLQTQIIQRIYSKTNNKHVIGRQSEDELLIVMRSIYLQHGKNVNTMLDKQIDVLNELVLDYCVDNVYSNLVAHFEYINDLTKDQPVLDMPQSTYVKGEKSLKPNHFF